MRPSLTWAHPLRLTQRLLHQALAERATYVHGWLLDVGCGARPYRHLFPRVIRYVGVDRPGLQGTDVYGDGLALPFRAGAFDSVLCNQVLEHVSEPGRLMAEIARVLKPGGALVMTAPQTWGLHLEPNDFYRYTRYGLQYLAEAKGLRVVDIAATCGLWATVAQRIVDTVVHTYAAGRSRWVVEMLAMLCAPVLLAGQLGDALAGKRGDTLDYVLVATKG